MPGAALNTSCPLRPPDVRRVFLCAPISAEDVQHRLSKSAHLSGTSAGPHGARCLRDLRRCLCPYRTTADEADLLATVRGSTSRVKDLDIEQDHLRHMQPAVCCKAERDRIRTKVLFAVMHVCAERSDDAARMRSLRRSVLVSAQPRPRHDLLEGLRSPAPQQPH